LDGTRGRRGPQQRLKQGYVGGIQRLLLKLQVHDQLSEGLEGVGLVSAEGREAASERTARELSGHG
jgi:hypothetical protein